MSDNIGYTPGTGATIAADEIAGVLHQRIKIGVGADGVAVDVSDSNPLPVIQTGEASEGNATTTPLAGGATFTGAAEASNHPDVMVTCKADADGTLYVDLSIDGTNWDTQVPFQVASGVGEFHTLVKGPRYCRVRFVNGAAAQTYLRLATYYGTFRQPNSSLRTPIQQDADAATVRAITEEIAIAGGLFTGYSIVNKFGTNGDIDTATVPEDMWDVGGVYTGFPDSTLELVEVVSSDANDAAAGTGARTIRITGLDANYDVQSETITLNGTTPVDSVNTYRRVHTASIQSAGSGGVNAGTITFRHTTTTANVFGSIVVGRNQTNIGAYTIPAGYTGYMRHLHGAIRGGTNATIDGAIWTRSFGGVFRSRRPFTIGLNSPLVDTIYGGLVFTEKSDITIRITLASANNCSLSGGFDLILVKN